MALYIFVLQAFDVTLLQVIFLKASKIYIGKSYDYYILNAWTHRPNICSSFCTLKTKEEVTLYTLISMFSPHIAKRLVH